MGQNNFILNDEVSSKIHFELISNLIVVPVEVNNVSLSFVLDTGVSKPILFNISENDAANLKQKETFYLYGLGGNGKLEAIRSRNNNFKFGDAKSFNQDLYVVYDEDIDFGPRLGITIHGIIGYDIFKDFVVEINYSSKFIRLHKSEAFNPKTSKRWRTIPLELHSKKPYLNATVGFNSSDKDVTLLMDTGSSDALWLFEDEHLGILPDTQRYFDDYLGKGLSGAIYGKRSKLSNFKLSEFSFNDVNVAFPDSSSLDKTRIYKNRNGSIGGNILKRFNLFIDYQNKRLYLKKNGLFKKPFTYNNSGIEVEYNGLAFVREEVRISNDDSKTGSSSSGVKVGFFIKYITKVKPVYIISEIREASNAFKSGIRKGDILVSINGKPAYDFELGQIIHLFHGKEGKTVRLKIERLGSVKTFKFKLEDAFQQKKLSN